MLTSGNITPPLPDKDFLWRLRGWYLQFNLLFFKLIYVRRYFWYIRRKCDLTQLHLNLSFRSTGISGTYCWWHAGYQLANIDRRSCTMTHPVYRRRLQFYCVLSPLSTTMNGCKLKNTKHCRFAVLNHGKNVKHRYC